MAAGPGGLGQQRRKPQHPPIDRDVVDLDGAFGEQLLDVAVRQRETQVPADRQHDHIRREAEAGEGRWRDSSRARTAGSHDTSLSARARSQQMQQRPWRYPAGCRRAAGDPADTALCGSASRSPPCRSTAWWAAWAAAAARKGPYCGACMVRVRACACWVWRWSRSPVWRSSPRAASAGVIRRPGRRRARPHQ